MAARCVSPYSVRFVLRAPFLLAASLAATLVLPVASAVPLDPELRPAEVGPVSGHGGRWTLALQRHPAVERASGALGWSVAPEPPHPAEDRLSLPAGDFYIEGGQTLELPAGYAARIVQDLGVLVRKPVTVDRRGWMRLGTGVAVVGIVSLFDEDLRSAVRSSSSEGTQRTARSIRPIGQETSLAVLGGAWLLGGARDNERFKSIARDGLESSLIAAGLIVPLTKSLTGRSRPRDVDEPDRFGSGGASFPSGEVTQAFAVASVVSAHSERKWVKALSWGLAASVFWQRMELDAHWASDATAGALLGTTVGRWVVRRHRPPEWERPPTVTFAPLVSDRSAGFAMTWTVE